MAFVQHPASRDGPAWSVQRDAPHTERLQSSARQGATALMARALLSATGETYQRMRRLNVGLRDLTYTVYAAPLLAGAHRAGRDSVVGAGS